MNRDNECQVQWHKHIFGSKALRLCISKDVLLILLYCADLKGVAVYKLSGSLDNVCVKHNP